MSKHGLNPQDHSRMDDGIRLWKCSGCGKESPWDKSWGWCGQLWNKVTKQESISFVACSIECAKEICSKQRCAGCQTWK